MPLFENKNTTEISFKAVIAIFLILLGILGIIGVFSGYISLGILAIAIVGTIAGIWMSSSGLGTSGIVILVVGAVVFALDTWLGTPILDWNRLIESIGW